MKLRWRGPRCARCERQVAACICRNVERGHVRAAKRKGVDVTPRPCPRGCGSMLRGGVCCNGLCPEPRR